MVLDSDERLIVSRQAVPNLKLQQVTAAMSSEDEEMGEVGWDVDALKAVRVFCNKRGKPTLRYLTSWVGFEPYWDEWTAKEDFGDPEQVTTFNEVIPASFNRTKFGETWYAPEEWVDKERRNYYAENPQALEKLGGMRIKEEVKRLRDEEITTARSIGREPFTQPRGEMQIQQDILDYNAFKRRMRRDKNNSKLQSKPRPGESHKGKIKNSVTTSAEPASTTKHLALSYQTARASASKQWTNAFDVDASVLAPIKRKKEEKIILGLRYKTAPITGFQSNTTFDRFRGRSNNGTRRSTPATHFTTLHRPLKTKNDLVIYSPVGSQSSPESPLGSAPDSLFDELADDISGNSDDSIPLARQASVRQGARKAITSITSESSDSDPPLSTRIAAGKTSSRQKVDGTVKGANIIRLDSSSTLKSLGRNLAQPLPPLNPRPTNVPQSENQASPITPITSKFNAWKEVGKLIPLGKNRQIASEPLASSTVKLTAQTATRAQLEPESDSEIVVEARQVFDSPPHFSGDEVISSEMHMDVDTMDPILDPIGFMQSVVQDIPLPPSEPKTKWTPVDLIMQSTDVEMGLCKVLLQKVTSAGPPSLKWIHKDGFKIRSFRAPSHLNILLSVYEPWQHAQLAALEEQDANVLAALTSYLYENGMFALADTNPIFDGTKLCFYPSKLSAVAESLNLPAFSELRQDPLHLLVTVIKPMGVRPNHSTITPTPLYLSESLELPSFRSSFLPAIARGLRILRVSPDIWMALQRKNSNDPKKRTYVISTAESMGFRHHNIDNFAAEEHKDKGVLHQEETLALIHIMKELGYKSKPNIESSSVVFIHNAAFDMSKHLLGLHDRKLRPKVWFFAYGPFHALEPRLWGVREIFKRGIEGSILLGTADSGLGGILTFTASGLMETASQIPKLLQCIDESATWMAFVSPLVVGLLQAAVIDDPDNQGAMLGLINVLEGAKAGKLSITSAPPHPWKVEDWNEWLKATSNFCITDDFTIKSGNAQDAILDSSEQALTEFAQPPSTQNTAATVAGRNFLKEFKRSKLATMSRTQPYQGHALEEAVDNQVFEDLRQMLSMPVLHTEYRRFVVLRSTETKPPSKDSIEHMRFQKLVDSDRPTFGSFPSSNAVSMPPPTPTSATSKQFVSPISV